MAVLHLAAMMLFNHTALAVLPRCDAFQLPGRSFPVPRLCRLLDLLQRSYDELRFGASYAVAKFDIGHSPGFACLEPAIKRGVVNTRILAGGTMRTADAQGQHEALLPH